MFFVIYQRTIILRKCEEKKLEIIQIHYQLYVFLRKTHTNIYIYILGILNNIVTHIL
jgi:hypothetical protein